MIFQKEKVLPSQAPRGQSTRPMTVGLIFLRGDGVAAGLQ